MSFLSGPPWSPSAGWRRCCRRRSDTNTICYNNQISHIICQIWEGSQFCSSQSVQASVLKSCCCPQELPCSDLFLALKQQRKISYFITMELLGEGILLGLPLFLGKSLITMFTLQNFKLQNPEFAKLIIITDTWFLGKSMLRYFSFTPLQFAGLCDYFEVKQCC